MSLTTTLTICSSSHLVFIEKKLSDLYSNQEQSQIKQSCPGILQNTGTHRTMGLVTCERCVCETLVEASECVPQSAPRSASSASDAVFVLASFCASSLILPSTTAWIDLEPSADYEVHILRPSYVSVAQFAQVHRSNGNGRAATPVTTRRI